MEIKLSELKSRFIRKEATGGTGIRRIATDAFNKVAGADGEDSNAVWGGLKRFAGFAISFLKDKIAPFLEWSATKIVGLIFSSIDFVWNFNWNISQEEANQKVEALLTQLAGQVGGVVGQSLGYAVCGALPGLVMFKFNPAMAVYVLQKLGDEALEEIGQSVGNLLIQTTKAGSAAFFVWSYANVKNFFRENLDAIEDAKLLELGMTPAKLEKLREDRKKPWSFASAYENWLESIPNALVRNFVEELGEEFNDACRDAAYIVASASEEYAIANKTTMDGLLGEETTVEILLNRQADEAIA